VKWKGTRRGRIGEGKKNGRKCVKIQKGELRRVKDRMKAAKGKKEWWEICEEVNEKSAKGKREDA
jgi:hypothetical protein